MTTVGITSMQRILNYGSSLQAYGLRRLIEGLGDDVAVSFVDYRPGPPLLGDGAGHATPRSQFSRRLSKVREYGRGEGALVDRLRFFDHKRAYAARYFPMIGVPDTPQFGLDLDVQVIGSDEVFNCVQSNTNVGYSRDLFGHGSPARRLVSYAASFGNTNLTSIQDAGIRADLEEDLGRFDAISVRDRNSVEIVQALTGTVPELHVDPALAYDFMNLEDRIPSGRLLDDPYVLVYGYSGRLTPSENSMVREYADRTGARVICLGGVQGCCDRFIDCDPFSLLALFRDASAVITDTFHGTIFSIINGVPFCTIVRRSDGHGYGNEEKLVTLLELFGLEAHRLADDCAVDRPLAEAIDRESVQRILESERTRSLDYLADQIR